MFFVMRTYSNALYPIKLLSRGPTYDLLKSIGVTITLIVVRKEGSKVDSLILLPFFLCIPKAVYVCIPWNFAVIETIASIMG